ncbi:MAG TPA: hypothetical protein VFH47_03050, partial [Candidatus Thermoplasmatota archaeon]|nr:hypothetical protein [Candidatus Thermoplasmatota archaeon]
MRKHLFALLAATALVTLLPSASAIYIITPHHIRVDGTEVEAGDTEAHGVLAAMWMGCAPPLQRRRVVALRP